jgi:hypothetical protein
MNLAGNTHRRTHFAPNTSNALGANPTWRGIKILGPGRPISLATCNALMRMGGSGVGIDPISVCREFTTVVAVTVSTRGIMGGSATLCG